MFYILGYPQGPLLTLTADPGAGARMYGSHYQKILSYLNHVADFLGNTVLERPDPEDRSESGSVPDWLPAFITIGLMVVATLIAFKVHRKKFAGSKGSNFMNSIKCN